MKRLVFIALFAATIVTLGLLFLTIPNVELVTLTCFLSGYLLGTRDGIAAAIVGEGLYSFLNPMGAAAPPLFIAQVFAMSLTAFVGSLVARHSFLFYNQFSHRKGKNSSLKISFSFGILGLILTLLFDVLTTASFLLFAGLSAKKFIASLLFGMHFYILHIGFNTIIFAVVLPIIIPRLRTWFELSKGNQQ